MGSASLELVGGKAAAEDIKAATATHSKGNGNNNNNSSTIKEKCGPDFMVSSLAPFVVAVATITIIITVKDFSVRIVLEIATTNQ